MTKQQKTQFFLHQFVSTLGGIALGLLIAAFIACPWILDDSDIFRFWNHVGF